MIRSFWSIKNSKHEITSARSTENLSRNAARGGFVSVSSGILKAFMQILLTVILSRLLSIEDYGLMAMAATAISFLAVFSDIGLGSAIVQRREIDHKLASNLFWIATFVGFGFFLFCAALAPYLADFYRDSRLTAIISFAGLSMPLAAIGSIHHAMMVRQFRWLEISTISIISQLVGGVIAICSALFFSAGYWALAYQSIAASAVNAALLWLRCRWRPGFPKRLNTARSAVSFGGYLMLFNVVNYAHRQMDNLMVGRELGAAQLGLYSRGYNLFMMPVTMIVWPVAGVITAALARRQQHPRTFAATYYSALATVYVITAPIAGGLFLFADEAIAILYGAKWVASADVLQILAISILWQPAYTSGGWIDMSLGRSKRHFYASIFAAGVYVTAFMVGVEHGIIGMAKAYLVANIIVILPWLWWTSRGTKITLLGIGRSIRGSILALAISLGSTTALLSYAPGQGLVHTFFTMASYVAVYLIITALFWKFDRIWSKPIETATRQLAIRNGV